MLQKKEFSIASTDFLIPKICLRSSQIFYSFDMLLNNKQIEKKKMVNLSRFTTTKIVVLSCLSWRNICT